MRNSVFLLHVIVVARIRSIQCTQSESIFYGRKTNRVAPLVIIHLQCQPTPPQRTPIWFALIINPTHSAHMLRKCQLCPNQFRADERFLAKINPLITVRTLVRLRPKTPTTSMSSPSSKWLSFRVAFIKIHVTRVSATNWISRKSGWTKRATSRAVVAKFVAIGNS